jgi:hypothetical protein
MRRLLLLAALASLHCAEAIKPQTFPCAPWAHLHDGNCVLNGLAPMSDAGTTADISDSAVCEAWAQENPDQPYLSVTTSSTTTGLHWPAPAIGGTHQLSFTKDATGFCSFASETDYDSIEKNADGKEVDFALDVGTLDQQPFATKAYRFGTNDATASFHFYMPSEGTVDLCGDVGTTDSDAPTTPYQGQFTVVEHSVDSALKVRLLLRFQAACANGRLVVGCAYFTG